MKKKITQEPIQAKTIIKQRYRIVEISDDGNFKLAEKQGSYFNGFFDSFDSIEGAMEELKNIHFYGSKEYAILPIVCVSRDLY